VLFEDETFGNLENYTNQCIYLEEFDALTIFKFFIEAVQIYHSKKVNLGGFLSLRNLLVTKQGLKFCELANDLQPCNFPPEKFNEDLLNSESDVWIMGCLLYRLIFGTFPYTGDSEHQIKENINQNLLQKLELEREIVCRKEISFYM